MEAALGMSPQRRFRFSWGRHAMAGNQPDVEGGDADPNSADGLFTVGSAPPDRQPSVCVLAVGSLGREAFLLRGALSGEAEAQ